MGIGKKTIGTETYGDGVGGPYVPLVVVTPSVAQQDAIRQSDINIGFVTTPSKDVVLQSDINIGFVTTPSKDVVLQSDINIGIYNPASAGGILLRIIRKNV